MSSKIFELLDRENTNNRTSVDLTIPEVKAVFLKLNKPDWVARLVSKKSGDDLLSTFDSIMRVPVLNISSWIIIEEKIENLFSFFNRSFGSFDLVLLTYVMKMDNICLCLFCNNTLYKYINM